MQEEKQNDLKEKALGKINNIYSKIFIHSQTHRCFDNLLAEISLAINSGHDLVIISCDLLNFGRQYRKATQLEMNCTCLLTYMASVFST